MAFKGGVVLGTVSLNATGSGTTNIGGTSNSGTITIGNGSSGLVTVGCGTAGINVGTTANAHTTTVGSTNSTSATTVQSGSGALNVTATNGALTINSGTGALGISTDASATTVSFATGGAAKTVTLGSTTTTSSLALKYGTSDFSLASATGTVMSALDTGEITYPLQPAFLAELQSSVNDVTGNSTQFTLGTTTALTEIFDQNSDFNPAGGTFTAPVTGRYFLSAQALITGCTIATTFYCQITTSNRQYFIQWTRAASSTNASCFCSSMCDMDAGDTATVQVATSGEAGATDDVNGAVSGGTSFGGYLVC